MGAAALALMAAASAAPAAAPPIAALPTAEPPLAANHPISPTRTPWTWLLLSDYPSAALKAKAEGTTGVRLLINKWGVVADCVVTKSAGRADLDEEACANAVRRARFTPATGKDAKPIAGSFTAELRWVLPDTQGVEPMNRPLPMVPRVHEEPVRSSSALPRPPAPVDIDWSFPRGENIPAKARIERRNGTTLVLLGTTAAGRVDSCEITKPSGYPDLDEAACALAKRYARFFPARDVNGNPTAGRIEQSVLWLTMTPDR